MVTVSRTRVSVSQSWRSYRTNLLLLLHLKDQTPSLHYPVILPHNSLQLSRLMVIRLLLLLLPVLLTLHSSTFPVLRVTNLHLLLPHHSEFPLLPSVSRSIIQHRNLPVYLVLLKGSRPFVRGMGLRDLGRPPRQQHSKEEEEEL